MNIQTDRLLFRRYSDEDFDFLHSLTADPEVMQYIGNGKTRDKDGALRFLYWVYKGYKENSELGLMLLVRKEDGKPVGQAGLVPQKVDDKEELEIGYWISRDFWGQGYATEAATVLRDYGLHSLKKERLVSLINPANTASRKVAENIGMKLEKKSLFSGQTIDVYAAHKEETI